MDFERASTAALIADLNARPALTLEAGDIGTWRWDSIHDLVVADTNLARMFGVSAQESRGAPLLTARARPEDRARALLSGYQAHISKPIDTRELIGAVAALAGRS